MPGYQVRDTCYDTPKDAAQASASANNGMLINRPEMPVSITVGKVTDTSIEYIYTTADRSVTYPSVQPYTAVPCVIPEVQADAVLKVISFGFGAVLMFWLIGYVVGIATGLVKKV